MYSDAIISPCRQYRYSLSRMWGTVRTRRCLFIMLNPSTADAFTADPTIRRCLAFCTAWGYDNLEVVNLFAYRATDPKTLIHTPDPVGPDNDLYLKHAITDSTKVICAWGANEAIRVLGYRDQDVLTLVKQYRDPYCLGITKGGYPRHPLYVKGDVQPIPYEGN